MLIDHIHDQLGKHRAGIIADNMPEFVKTAEEAIVTEDLTKLADGAFAYSDGVNRFFPIHTPEHTWLSRSYLEKFAHTLEESVANNIRVKINDAATAFGLKPTNFEKLASQEDEVDELHSLSLELNKFLDNYKKLPVEDRRSKAKEIISRAHALGRHGHMPDVISRYGGDRLSTRYAEAFDKRMKYFKVGSPERKYLLDMQSQHKDHSPELFAKALYLLDKKLNLHNHYDGELEDPYLGMLENGTCDEEPVDIDGHKLYESKVKAFDFSSLSDLFDNSLLDSFKSNPIEGLRNADPQVRVIIIRRMNNA